MEPIKVGNCLLYLECDDDPIWMMVADIGQEKLILCRCRYGYWGEVDLSTVDQEYTQDIARWLVTIGKPELYAINLATGGRTDISDEWDAQSNLEMQLDSVLSDIRGEQKEISGKELVALLVSSEQAELLPVLLTRLIVSAQTTTDNIEELTKIDLDLL